MACATMNMGRLVLVNVGDASGGQNPERPPQSTSESPSATRHHSNPFPAHPAHPAATVARLGTTAEEVIKQNNAVNIYESFFTDVEVDHSNELPEAKTLTVFRDPSPVPRSASYLSYHHSGTRVAVAYSILRFQSQPTNMPLQARAHGTCAVVSCRLAAALAQPRLTS